MAELEIHHHEGGHGDDPLGKKVGVLAAVFAVLLAITTILSHRAHTESVMKKSTENDTWAYFQSKKIKLHMMQVGRDVITLTAPKNEATTKTLEEYETNIKKYEKDSDALNEKATKIGEDVESIERRAIKFDLGEGLLEIALVMSSLYFIAKKKLFPTIGVLAGLAGLAFAAYGLMLQLT
jgi:hypothetical protein